MELTDPTNVLTLTQSQPWPTILTLLHQMDLPPMLPISKPTLQSRNQMETSLQPHQIVFLNHLNDNRNNCLCGHLQRIPDCLHRDSPKPVVQPGSQSRALATESPTFMGGPGVRRDPTRHDARIHRRIGQRQAQTTLTPTSRYLRRRRPLQRSLTLDHHWETPMSTRTRAALR